MFIIFLDNLVDLMSIFTKRDGSRLSLTPFLFFEQ